MDNWFTKLTGLSDDRPETVRSGIVCDGTTLTCPNGRVMQAGDLAIPSLAELRAVTAGLCHAGTSTTAREVVADAQDLHRDPQNANAIFQVASQFNLLEMISPSVGPQDGIARYADDHTQGPACAIACAAGTIYRNYFAPLDGQIGQNATRQIDTLSDLGALLGNETGQLWEMRNGYALPTAAGLVKLNKTIANTPRDTLLGAVRIGLQSDTAVTLAGATHHVTQAYCSALPIAYSDQMPWHLAPLACAILDAAYEATFHAAVHHKARTGNTKLFLTFVGGGAFGNDPAMIIASIQRALDLFKDAGLDVRIVSYGQPSPHVAKLLS